jgi:hypothetical protein
VPYGQALGFGVAVGVYIEVVEVETVEVEVVEVAVVEVEVVEVGGGQGGTASHLEQR